MHIVDFIKNKIEEVDNLEESESNNLEHEKLTPEEIKNYKNYASIIPALTPEEYKKALNKRIGVEELKTIETDSDMKFTSSFIKKCKYPITIMTLMFLLNTDRINQNKYTNNLISKQNIIATKDIKKLEETIPNVNIKVIKNDIKEVVEEVVEEINKQKLNNKESTKNKHTKSKSKTKDLSKKTKKDSFLNTIKKRENRLLFDKKITVVKPHWDELQWSVGYGISVEGFNSKKIESKNRPPYSGKNNKWVTNFRKVYGDIKAHPDDKDPSPECPEGQLSRDTVEAAFEVYMKKQNESIAKRHKFVKILPENIRNVTTDITYNIGPNTLNNFVKFSEHLTEISLILKTNKKLTNKNLIKKYDEHLLGAMEELIKSDYFVDSHLLRKIKLLNKKRKTIQKFKRNMKSKNKATRVRNKRYYKKELRELETSRPFSNLLLLSKEFKSKKINEEDLLKIMLNSYEFFINKSKKDRSHFKKNFKINSINENLLRSYIINLLNS